MHCQSSPGARIRFSPVRYRAHPNVPSYADCVYCGEPAQCRDHFVPISLISKWPRVLDSRHVRRLLFIVPACTSCNCTANDKAFRSFEAKRAYIRGRIRHRHRKAIYWRAWVKEDYQGAGYKLRELATSVAQERERALRRLNYECPYDVDLLPGPEVDDAPRAPRVVVTAKPPSATLYSFPSTSSVPTHTSSVQAAPTHAGNAGKRNVRRRRDPVCVVDPDKMVTLPDAARLVGRRHHIVRDAARGLTPCGEGVRGRPYLYRLGDIVSRMEQAA